MASIEQKKTTSGGRLSIWLLGLIPIIALGLMLSIFAFANPLALFRADVPPAEDLTVEQVRVVPDGFEAVVMNGGPAPVTISQVTVDDAYWQFEITPGATLPRLGQATVKILYPWVQAEPHQIALVTSTGLTFLTEVAQATETPTPGAREFMAYGLLGIYVGIIPVGLGMLWFPALKRLGRKWLGAILALTLGLLVFLLIDTILEALEVAEVLPGVFQGVPLMIFAALLTWLVLLAVGTRRSSGRLAKNLPPGVYVAGLIALGIGLHNLGEGLAIGAAFALGEAALGAFLVIGFTLHNITEGVGIVAPLLPGGSGDGQAEKTTPRLRVFVALAALAGLPAVLGTWIGGFAYSPLLSLLFLGIGVGAIWQVIVEVGKLLRRYADVDGTALTTWANVVGFLAGIAIMYLTAFLVKF
jgi:zinc transporter, ZIP family